MKQVSFYEMVPVLKAAGEVYLCPPRQSKKNKASSKQGTEKYSTCWHKHGPDKEHDNESHIHIVPGITARTCTIISEYMRYKIQPRCPCKQERALKILLIHAIKKALQAVETDIIKSMELH